MVVDRVSRQVADHYEERELMLVKKSSAGEAACHKVNIATRCSFVQLLYAFKHSEVLFVNQFYFYFREYQCGQPREEPWGCIKLVDS